MTNLSVKKIPKEPNLRFPEFRGEWEEKELRELAEINPNTPKPEGEFIYLDLASVKKGVIVNYQKLTSENAPSRAQRILKQQDILFATVASHQQNNLLFKEKEDQVYVASTGFFQIRAKLCETKFLYHSLHTDKIKKIVISRSTGTTYPTINYKNILDIIIAHPPSLQEQTKIGNFLSLMDDRIESQNKIIKDLEVLKKNLNNDLMEVKIRFPEFKGEWEDRFLLQDLLNVEKGQQLNKRDFVEKGRYYVMNGGIKPSGYYSQNNTPSDTITISSGGSSGHITFHKEPFWTGGDCFILTNIKPEIYKVFLYHYLKKNEKEIKDLSTGTSLKHLSKKSVLSFEIIIPPSLQEQTKIGNFLSLMDEKIKLEKELLNNYELQKKYFLKNLF